MAITPESNTNTGEVKRDNKSTSRVPTATKGGKLIHYPRRDHVVRVSSQSINNRPRKGSSAPHTKASMYEVAEERRIVKAVLKGDLVDFQVLVRRYHKPIYHLMYRVMRNVMTAEDLTQETFTRAYEKLHTFNVRKRFFPWIYAIGVNLTKDYLRRQGVTDNLFSDTPASELWPDPNGEDCAKKPDCVLEVGQVAGALEELPIGYSEPMLLFYREGFTVKEISGALGISSAAVKVRLHRGRKKLMHKLGVGYE